MLFSLVKLNIQIDFLFHTFVQYQYIERQELSLKILSREIQRKGTSFKTRGYENIIAFMQNVSAINSERNQGKCE